MGLHFSGARSLMVCCLLLATMFCLKPSLTLAAAWEQQLASYHLDKGNLVKKNIDIGLEGKGNRVHPLELDPRVHQHIWNVVSYIFPAWALSEIDFLVFYTDGNSGSHGLITTEPRSRKLVLGIDIRDILRRRKDGRIVIDEKELAQTLSHELFHSLSFAENQVHRRPEWLTESKHSHSTATHIRSCPPGAYIRVGCSKKGSYLREFMTGFWGNDLRRWYHALTVEPERGQMLGMFRAGKYVSSYASTDPQEDLAESFSSFVFADKINLQTIAGKKVYFFAGYPELQKLRHHIRSRLARIAAPRRTTGPRLAFNVTEFQ